MSGAPCLKSGANKTSSDTFEIKDWLEWVLMIWIWGSIREVLLKGWWSPSLHKCDLKSRSFKLLKKKKEMQPVSLSLLRSVAVFHDSAAGQQTPPLAPPTLPSQLPPQPRVKVLLVDPGRLLVPAVVGQQRHVAGGDGAHLHGTSRPLHRIEVVEPLMEDKGWRAAVWRSVWGVCQPAGLWNRVPGKEHVPQLFLGQRLLGENLPDVGLAGRRTAVALWNVHWVQGAEAADGSTFGVGGEHVRKCELGGRLRAAKVGRVQGAVDQRGDGLMVAARVVWRDKRREPWEGDVRLALVEWCCYHNDVVERVSRSRLTHVIDLIETGRDSCEERKRKQWWNISRVMRRKY